MIKNTTIRKLEGYINTEECIEYNGLVNKSSGFYYLLSILFENDGDWNLVNFDKISEEDILELEKFVAYGTTQSYYRLEKIPAYDCLEENYDQSKALKKLLEEYEKNPIELGLQIDLI
jgi:hypothetical protein